MKRVVTLLSTLHHAAMHPTNSDKLSGNSEKYRLRFWVTVYDSGIQRACLF